MKHKIPIISLLCILAFLIRLFPINFPPFTTDEARIAYRGYALSSNGVDELGRNFPFIFNSLSDYQLPLTPYITVLGVAIFGKEDLGARIMFIIAGTLIAFLTYKIAPRFASGKDFAFLSSLIVAFSPALIFFSKIPNEFIILTFLILLLFYILTREKINLIFVFGFIFLILLTSKLAWLILPPFIILTCFYFSFGLSKRNKIIISAASFILSLLIIFLFLQIPQGVRSLSENNFYISQSDTVKNGIAALRGQGLESKWPDYVERLLFNKGQYISVGMFHWLSHLNLSVLFGQFDNSGNVSFAGMGAFPKILIIPFIFGLVSQIRKSLDIRISALLIYPFILTYPLLFIYPLLSPHVVILILPFLSFICAYGLINLNKYIKSLIICLAILELIINLANTSFNLKVSNNYRPEWVKSIVNEGYNLSKNSKVAFSDDITLDIIPFLQWHNAIGIENTSLDQFPYRFRQTRLKNIITIGSNDIFYNCGLDEPTHIFASERDIKEIKRWLNIDTDKIVKKIYSDNLEQRIASLLEPTVCIRKS